MSTAVAVQPSRQLTLTLLPEAFPDGIGRLPANPVVATFVEAFFKGGKRARTVQNGWTANKAGSPIYRHNSGNHEIVVYTTLSHGADEEPANKEAEWRLIETLDAWVVDATLSCLTQLCERHSIGKSMYSSSNSSPEAVLMTAGTILRNKGIRRRGKERLVLCSRIDAAMQALQSLEFDASWTVPDLVNGKPRYLQRKWRGDQLFNLVALETLQTSLWGDEARVVTITWSIQHGQWARFWFNAELKAELSILRVVSTLAW